MNKKKLVENRNTPTTEGYKPSEKTVRGYRPVDKNGYQPEKGKKTPPSPPSEE